MADLDCRLTLVRVYCSDPSGPGECWHQDFDDLYKAQKYADAMKKHFSFVHIQIIIFQEVDRIDT